MIIPKGNDRSWPREYWYFMQRMFRCTERVMGPKFEKAQIDMMIYGTGHYEQTKEDLVRINDLITGKRP